MAKRNRDPELKGISRIDSNGTHGWFVRVYRNGRTYSKLYSDNKYGGKDRALSIAKKARELALETIPVVKKSKEARRRLTQSGTRNKTGIVGVNRTEKANKEGVISEYYQVTWAPEIGKIRNKQWSVQKFGPARAFEHAWNFRQKVMRDIYGDKYNPQNDILDREQFERHQKGFTSNPEVQKKMDDGYYNRRW